ncbi:NAD(P)/FAD-dependent oxidoreductase [Dysosmobacter sp.]|uniref:NAD(P)/FAD-dependent oxidoreductase n=1 Tax=Dysosmobacter sp. TaxID=2591382 RepID=UPI002A84D800|nr:NAD(P)/FAD-dependent oxidoreductase [Dysosmobacter sp.]MDY3281588.1 NAD(P)/FAD-dependent oxidoreductase [Dysosmobacter sp.]
MDYSKLFEPISIGKMQLKNRVIMGPLGSAMADENHFPTPVQARYYAERAKGGVAMVMVEHTGVQLTGVRSATATGMWDPAGLPAWKRVVDAIHENGARAGIQLGHQGSCTDYSRILGGECVAASHIRCYKIQEKTRPMTLEEMEQFKRDYVKSVLLAVEAGFDTVMFHMTNGYFLASWLSGRTNKRTDRYGGNLENRMRFPLEVVAAVREAVGPDYPLMARLATREVNGGRSLEETRIIARALQDAGIDAIDLNSGSWSEYDWEFPSYFQQEGFLLEDAEKIRRSVHIPIISGGRITEPLMAAQALEDGRCDIISVTRAMLADPFWLKKTEQGETQSIRRCIACTRCINDREHGGLICNVNPFERREEELAIHPTDSPRRICVVGAGVAGLQAASVAAQRGHHVTVVEKEAMPGGMVSQAGVPPLKWEILNVVSAIAYDAEKYGAEFLYNTTATPEWLREQNFDHVIVATGAKPVIPPIPNDGSLAPFTAVSVLSGENWVGQKVAMIGGGWIGCETAEFLAKYHRDITIFEMLDGIGSDMYPAMREKMLHSLEQSKVRVMTGCRVAAFENGCVRYLQDNEEKIAGPFDSIVFSAGMKADHTLEEQLRAVGIEPIVIGNAFRADRIHEALTSAVEATVHL